MKPAEHLQHLQHEVAGFAAVLAVAPLDAIVGGCPGWTLRDLTFHLGGVHRWAAGCLRTGIPAAEPTGTVPDAALAGWFTEGATDLVALLGGTAPDAATWTFAPPATAAFWFRRQALETAVHRVDAQRCVGSEQPVPAALAADGVDEVVRTLMPRQLALGRAVPPATAVSLVAADTGERWTVGPGAPVASVTGGAHHLLMLLWRRADRHSPMLTVEGDLTCLDDVLALSLTP